MKDWGADFASRQSSADAKARAAEESRKQQEQREREVRERIKVLMVRSVLPEFRNFATGARQAKDVVAKVEAMSGDAPVLPEDEGLDSVVITGARLRVMHAGGYEATLRIRSTSTGLLFSELTTTKGIDQKQPLGEGMAAGTIETLLRHFIDFAMPEGK